jgi:hypothetical protein
MSDEEPECPNCGSISFDKGAAGGHSTALVGEQTFRCRGCGLYFTRAQICGDNFEWNGEVIRPTE